ncbi:hypothetical protein CL634_02065 [bacterium]|nr:hypothetical protein [bacterium]
MIPKIIHQSWISDVHPDIPEVFREYMDSIPANFPNWKYILWDNESSREVVNEVAPNLIDLYDSSEDIMKSDISRFCFLYKHGGLYLDLDIKINENIEDLFKEDCCYLIEFDFCNFFKDKGWDTLLSNCLMACDKNNEFMRLLATSINKKYLDALSVFGDRELTNPNFKVLMKTGPGYITKMYNIYNKTHKVKALYILGHPSEEKQTTHALGGNSSYKAIHGRLKSSWTKKF